jgi:phage terminase large subunit
MPSSRKQTKANEIKKIVSDPLTLTKVLLCAALTGKQKEILLSVVNNTKTAVKACHSSGKTFVAAVVVLWWLMVHREAVVITTAPTWIQVERVLWGEIHAALARARYVFPRPSATKLELAPNRYALGLSTNEGVRFQGFHSPNILIIIDEAPGVDGDIYEAIEGIRAGGNARVLALGNPVMSSGPFHDAFTENRENWNLITISAFDTPNLEGVTLDSLLQMSGEELDANPYPYLTTRRWVREKFDEWGPGHPVWDSRVLANFPTQADDTLFPLTWLEQAKLRTEGEGEYHAGIDVAGPGDDETVLCVRSGRRIVLIRAWTKSDPRGEVIAALRPYKDRLKALNIDSAGIGYYFAKHLEDEGLPVTEINVGQKPKDSDVYFNRKAEVYWEFRVRLQTGEVSCLTDERTIAQLAGIRYEHDGRGRIVIESKEDARKRGVKSPDRAEAVILAFAEIAPVYALIEAYKTLAAQEKSGESPANDPPTSCPACGSALAKIGIQWRCQNCGKQFGPKPEVAKGPSREDHLRMKDDLGGLGGFDWKRWRR